MGWGGGVLVGVVGVMDAGGRWGEDGGREGGLNWERHGRAPKKNSSFSNIIIKIINNDL